MGLLPFEDWALFGIACVGICPGAHVVVYMVAWEDYEHIIFPYFAYPDSRSPPCASLPVDWGRTSVDCDATFVDCELTLSFSSG